MKSLQIGGEDLWSEKESLKAKRENHQAEGECITKML